jgi:hypothetical protein
VTSPGQAGAATGARQAGAHARGSGCGRGGRRACDLAGAGERGRGCRVGGCPRRRHRALDGVVARLTLDLDSPDWDLELLDLLVLALGGAPPPQPLCSGPGGWP